MKDSLKQALEIVKNQSSVRAMTPEDVAEMIETVARTINKFETPEEPVEEIQQPAVDPRKAIREHEVICVECGKAFKVLTKRHLETHGLTTEEYKEKWGYSKDTSLICKSLSKQRRAKMKEMSLWERRKHVGGVKVDEPIEPLQRRKEDVEPEQEVKKTAAKIIEQPEKKSSKQSEKKDWDAVADKIIKGK